MKYVLGIDNGGTSFRVRALDPDGNLLGEYQGEGCSHYQFGMEGARQRVEKNIAACLQGFGASPTDCLYLVCGSTGCDSEEDEAILTDIYGHISGLSCPAKVLNDVQIAHYATVGRMGLLILAGTGSITYGRNSAGKEARVGGWPKGLMGEEGSGRYLDALALRYYCRYMDGCRERNELIEEIEKTVGGPGRKALMDYGQTVMEPEFSSSGLAPAVNRAAENGNDEAVRMLHQAAESLMEVAEENIKLLKLDQEETLPVGLWGGVILHSRIMREHMEERLMQKYPKARFLLPEKEAVQGAAEMALEGTRHSVF